MRNYEFKEGYNDYLDGKHRYDNPYDDDSAEAQDWEDGYYQAMEDD